MGERDKSEHKLQWGKELVDSFEKHLLAFVIWIWSSSIEINW